MTNEQHLHQSTRESLRAQLAERAECVKDMAERVLSNGGEPNYAGEKMGRAARAAIEALAIVDELYMLKWDGDPPYEGLDLESREREVAADAASSYGRERRSWR